MKGAELWFDYVVERSSKFSLPPWSCFDRLVVVVSSLIQLNPQAQNVSRPWREPHRRYKSELRIVAITLFQQRYRPFDASKKLAVELWRYKLKAKVLCTYRRIRSFLYVSTGHRVTSDHSSRGCRRLMQRTSRARNFFGISISWYKKFKSWNHADRLDETRNSLMSEWKGPEKGFVEKHSLGKECRGQRTPRREEGGV